MMCKYTNCIFIFVRFASYIHMYELVSNKGDTNKQLGYCHLFKLHVIVVLDVYGYCELGKLVSLSYIHIRVRNRSQVIHE